MLVDILRRTGQRTLTPVSAGNPAERDPRPTLTVHALDPVAASVAFGLAAPHGESGWAVED
jgi:hypothetical protein